MSVTLTNVSIPTGGRLEIDIKVSAQVNFSALAARRKVNRFVLSRIGNLLHGGEPEMVLEYLNQPINYDALLRRNYPLNFPPSSLADKSNQKSYAECAEHRGKENSARYKLWLCLELYGKEDGSYGCWGAGLDYTCLPRQSF